ncbi:MAG TPA: thioether cross-link-forming SCIFF peptide maturase [Bacillota bacterium]|nr:thioether cross-link-forming SCIFF peptide maturase [Bacillota bacterium]HPM00228.1 thioether cross-link-forming SCIFF peptide maturase [Bacillota bacterium]HPW41577.1 thioether cross-link-forming SCIFF peptide maturase [Bacillota bacterium]
MLHRYEQKGLKIVVDVNSGAVHVVDQLTWDILDHYPDSIENIVGVLKGKHEECNIREAWNEVRELESQGLLNSADVYMDKVLEDKKEMYTKALCLNVAHDCNMRCGYCFASTGDYHGGRKLMPFSVASRAVEFLLESSGNRKRLEVDFFGGEPLMNFDVVKETVLFAREREKEYGKRIGFTITTNGALLGKKTAEFINENMDNIVLSIDGRKQVNDRMRKFTDGAGTYDDIMPKLKSFVASRGDKSYYIRGTFTANNLDFCSDVLHLADEGFKEISIEPVAAEKGKAYALKEEHLPRIYREYDRLAEKYIDYYEKGKGFRYYHFLMDLDGGPCVYKRVSSCGSGVEYFAVTPDGELYPCHQFVGRKEYLMGDVWKGVSNKELQKEFSGNTVYHKEKCRECWARFYCSGGCQANAAAFNNNLKEPYDIECKLQKKRIECAIMIKAYEKLKN